MGFHNDLVAVGYGDGTHFTGTFFFDGAGKDYGCQKGSICGLMNMVGSPFVFETKAGSQCGTREGM